MTEVPVSLCALRSIRANAAMIWPWRRVVTLTQV